MLTIHARVPPFPAETSTQPGRNCDIQGQFGTTRWSNSALQTIHEHGEMLSLTDMWRAAGGDDSKRPSFWVRHDGTQAFIEHLVGTVIPDHSEPIQSLNEGGTWHTWAHWQIAMAYAKKE